MREYDSEFYADMEITSLLSAQEVVPILLERFNPASIVDVGCGTGAFAAEFLRSGITAVVGYEGDWMEESKTLLPKENYIYADITERIKNDRNFDLCLCLEVGEHLDISKASILIENLVSLSSRIVFSAAIPMQGGNHHVNEQWPQFWAEMFAAKGYFMEWDPRLTIWNNSNIASCYRQNLIVYSRNFTPQIVIPLSLVHPETLISALKYKKTPFWFIILGIFPRPYLRYGKRVMRKAFRKAK